MTTTNAIAISEPEMILHWIATGLIALHQQVIAGSPARVPYPPSLQRGLDKLIARCIQGQTPGPQSVPDLVAWCRRPLTEWPLGLPPDAVEPHHRLLEQNRISEVCEEWACANPNVESEWSERTFMDELFRACRAANAPSSYTAFRQLLIRHPILTEPEMIRLSQKPALEPVLPLLRLAYSPAPFTHVVDGVFYPCKHCGHLLVKTVEGDLTCEEPRCLLRGHVARGRAIPAAEKVTCLRRDLRRFVAAPGLSELRLARHLRRLGVQVDLWPNYDAYDLRIVFPDQEAWAVDVKDWENPFLLARRVQPIPAEPPWLEAFYVFPNERRRDRRDYKRAFAAHCRVLGAHVKALFERELVTRVERRLGQEA